MLNETPPQQPAPIGPSRPLSAAAPLQSPALEQLADRRVGCRVLVLIWAVCCLAGWKAVELALTALAIVMAHVRVLIVPLFAVALLAGCSATQPPREVRKAVRVPRVTDDVQRVRAISTATAATAGHLRSAAASLGQAEAAAASARLAIAETREKDASSAIDVATAKIAEARRETAAAEAENKKAWDTAADALGKLEAKDKELLETQSASQMLADDFNRLEVKAAQLRELEQQVNAWWGLGGVWYGAVRFTWHVAAWAAGAALVWLGLAFLWPPAASAGLGLLSRIAGVFRVLFGKRTA